MSLRRLLPHRRRLSVMRGRHAPPQSLPPPTGTALSAPFSDTYITRRPRHDHLSRPRRCGAPADIYRPAPASFCRGASKPHGRSTPEPVQLFRFGIWATVVGVTKVCVRARSVQRLLPSAFAAGPDECTCHVSAAPRRQCAPRGNHFQSAAFLRALVLTASQDRERKFLRATRESLPSCVLSNAQILRPRASSRPPALRSCAVSGAFSPGINVCCPVSLRPLCIQRENTQPVRRVQG